MKRSLVWRSDGNQAMGYDAKTQRKVCEIRFYGDGEYYFNEPRLGVYATLEAAQTAALKYYQRPWWRLFW